MQCKLYLRLAIAVCAVALTTGMAKANAIIGFTDLADDPTYTEALDATVTMDATIDSIDITVENDADFAISRFFFNGPATLDVTGFEGTVPASWSISTDNVANSFGEFDWVVKFGGDPLPANDVSDFSLTYDGFVTEEDFVTELSNVPPGGPNKAVSVLKFIGEQDFEVFGAAMVVTPEGGVIPEPASMLTLGAMSVLGLARRRRHA